MATYDVVKKQVDSKPKVSRPKTIASVVKFTNGDGGLRFAWLAKPEKLPAKLDKRGKPMPETTVIGRFELDKEMFLPSGEKIIMRCKGRSVSILICKIEDEAQAEAVEAAEHEAEAANDGLA